MRSVRNSKLSTGRFVGRSRSKLPSKSVYKKPGPKFGRVVVQKLDYLRSRKDFETEFCMMPLKVMFDQRLKHSDKLIYCSVAFLAWQDGKACRESLPVIAALVNASRSQAVESVKRLLSYGHLKRVTVGRGAPAVMAPVFESTSRPVASTGAEPVSCVNSKCKSRCRQVGKTGFCHTCARAAELSRQYESARAVLGSDASLRDIAEYLGIEKQERKLLKALRRMGVAA